MDENSKVRKLGEFPETSEFNASDVLFAEQNGKARKLPGLVLQKFCQDSIQTLVTAVQKLAQTTAGYEIKARESAAAASENAETASSSADLAAQAVTAASQYTNSAQTYAKGAQLAANAAENARDAIVNMEVTAETLAPGADATVETEMVDGRLVVSFGLPRGDRGLSGGSPIVEEVSGDEISVSDSSDMDLEGLKLFGKTTQDGTPAPDAPVPLVSVGDGGSITVKIGVSAEDTATQSITANTPNGLPGIPVTSGGNYTDANGQQWICDEVDFARGKYVHRVGGGKLTDITSWFFDHEIDGGYLMFKGTIPGTWYRNIEGYKYERTNGLYTHGRYREYYSPRYSQVYMAGASVYVVVGRENASDADAFKAWVDAQSAAGNTPEVMVALDPDRIAETDLTAEEIAAFKALHTNKPNTTVYNDGGAGMEMAYIADTKLYIDNKFAELQNAILSAGANV